VAESKPPESKTTARSAIGFRIAEGDRLLARPIAPGAVAQVPR
jgi:hypothetical protein